jgi:DNA segregation ATPase FtsK/SpoIIIE, S-DNA-T family
VVAGVTGSGKSELLITWILALCTTHSTAEVNFLLADFKGGTAFDALEGLPHVTGVITDLDGTGARRAIQSLRAEVRWRESVLAEMGARDVLDPRVALPRLVVVVDEFAALLGDHPELHAVFSDVAARGRALGLHLVLGTQRAAGVIRDSLLANCPLRISLRVTDGGDSRALLGVDDAAQLPGGLEARGLALIRRAADAAPRQVRIALSSPADIDAARHSTGPTPRRPWLPALPLRVTLSELQSHEQREGDLLLGLADEPERQRQRAFTLTSRNRSMLVVGAAGAGKSNTLELIAAQTPDAVARVPADPESAWDVLAELVEQPAKPGTVVLIDDLDMLASRFSAEHSQLALERVEAIVRMAGAREMLVVAAAQRLTGPVARLADLFAMRVILALPTRAEHLAAGGDTEHFAADAPAGRGRIGGLAVQVALAPEPVAPPPTSADAAAWHPTAALTGFIARRSPGARTAIARWQQCGVEVMSVDEYVADPSATARAAVVLVGEPDDWQRHWRLLADIRGDHDLLIDASCGPELRLLTGFRGTPPHLEPGRSRAWLISAGHDPVRIVLPTDGIEADRRRRMP